MAKMACCLFTLLMVGTVLADKETKEGSRYTSNPIWPPRRFNAFFKAEKALNGMLNNKTYVSLFLPAPEIIYVLVLNFFVFHST